MSVEKKNEYNDILEDLQLVVVEQLGVKETDIKEDSSFANDLGADSLDTVELVMAIEEQFNIEIPDEKAEGIKTVRQAAEYIQNTLNEGNIKNNKVV